MNFWTFLDRNMAGVVFLGIVTVIFTAMAIDSVAKAHVKPLPACIDAGAR